MQYVRLANMAFTKGATLARFDLCKGMISPIPDFNQLFLLPGLVQTEVQPAGSRRQRYSLSAFYII